MIIKTFTVKPGNEIKHIPLTALQSANNTGLRIRNEMIMPIKYILKKKLLTKVQKIH